MTLTLPSTQAAARCGRLCASATLIDYHPCPCPCPCPCLCPCPCSRGTLLTECVSLRACQTSPQGPHRQNSRTAVPRADRRCSAAGPCCLAVVLGHRHLRRRSDKRCSWPVLDSPREYSTLCSCYAVHQESAASSQLLLRNGTRLPAVRTVGSRLGGQGDYH